MPHPFADNAPLDTRPFLRRARDEKYLTSSRRRLVNSFRLAGIMALGVPLLLALGISVLAGPSAEGISAAANVLLRLGSLVLVSLFSLATAWLLGALSLAAVASVRWGIAPWTSLRIFLTLRYPREWFVPVPTPPRG